jgi:hypothetical protein
MQILKLGVGLVLLLVALSLFFKLMLLFLFLGKLLFWGFVVYAIVKIIKKIKNKR